MYRKSTTAVERRRFGEAKIPLSVQQKSEADFFSFAFLYKVFTEYLIRAVGRFRWKRTARFSYVGARTPSIDIQFVR